MCIVVSVMYDYCMNYIMLNYDELFFSSLENYNYSLSVFRHTLVVACLLELKTFHWMILIPAESDDSIHSYHCNNAICITVIQVHI